MKIKNFIFIIGVIFTHACTSPESSICEFDPRIFKGKEFTLSEIADDITYVPLDNAFPLHRIVQTIFTRDAIYLNSVNIGILRYGRNGSFINKIGSIGRGPGEYIFYMFFCVDDKSGKVYNISDGSGRIQVFSKNGDLIGSFLAKDYGTSISNILFYNSDLFIQCAIEWEDANYEWMIYDTLGNLVKKQKRHLPNFYNNSSGAGNPYKFKNKLSYYNSWTDTIFSISPDLAEFPSIILSPGEHRFPRSYVPMEDIAQKKYFILSKIFETERFLVIKYYYRKYSLALIDKKNRETFLDHYEWNEGLNGLPVSGVINDLDGGSWFLPDNYFTEDGNEYMIGLQYPYQIISRVASHEFKNSAPKYPEKKKELEKLANNLKETDNPVLVLVRLKK